VIPDSGRRVSIEPNPNQDLGARCPRPAVSRDLRERGSRCQAVTMKAMSSSTYVRRDGKWLSVLYQETPTP